MQWRNAFKNDQRAVIRKQVTVDAPRETHCLRYTKDIRISLFLIELFNINSLPSLFPLSYLCDLIFTFTSSHREICFPYKRLPISSSNEIVSYESAATWDKLSVKWSQRSLHKANESLLDRRKLRLRDSRLLRDGNSHVKQLPCRRYELLIPRTWLIDNCVRLVASKTYLREWSTRNKFLNKFPPAIAIIEKSRYVPRPALACSIYLYIFNVYSSCRW